MKRTAPTAKRQRTTDSELASYRATALRVLEEHERGEAAPAHAPARARSSPSPAAPAQAPQAAAPQTGALAAAAANLATARRSLERTRRRAASRLHHDSLAGFGPRHPASAALAETEHAVLDVGVDANGGFSGASVFVVCQHGALMGCAGGIWQDFGGRRDGDETPYETAFRELREEIGLTASHVDVLPDQPLWVVHAGYRHAVFVATLSEENRLRPDWNLGDEETPELDSYRNNFVDFANFFADDMVGDEFVHRRMKTREIFDLASSAYCDMRRAAHRAKAAANAAASSDSDDDDGDGDSPPAPPQRLLASTATSSASQLGDGAGRPSAASSVATPTHGRPPDTAAAAADAAAAPVSASARVPRAVVEHEQATLRSTAHGPDPPPRLPSALDGAGRPSAASSVATPTHGRPPDTTAAAADAAAALVSAPARVPRAVAEHEQTSSALTSYHSGSESPTALATPLLHPEGTPAPTGGTFAQRADPCRVSSLLEKGPPPRGNPCTHRRDLCAASRPVPGQPAAREGTRDAVPASYEATADRLL